jgi:tRNA(fMet)-specific endonuclease VapC
MAELVDSSVLIALERRGEPADFLRTIAGSESLGISTISVSELLVGAHRADTEIRRLRRERFLNEILSLVPVMPFDLASARVHAQLWARLSQAGTMIDNHDLIIAATALANDHDILTDNLRDFERVPGLVVNRPDWP